MGDSGGAKARKGGQVPTSAVKLTAGEVFVLAEGGCLKSLLGGGGGQHLGSVTGGRNQGVGEVGGQARGGGNIRSEVSKRRSVCAKQGGGGQGGWRDGLRRGGGAKEGQLVGEGR